VIIRLNPVIQKKKLSSAFHGFLFWTKFQYVSLFLRCFVCPKLLTISCICFSVILIMSECLCFSKWLTGICGRNSLNLQVLVQGQPGRESLTYTILGCYAVPLIARKRFPQLFIMRLSPVSICLLWNIKINIFISVTVFWAALTLIYSQRTTSFGSGDISSLLQNNTVIQQQITCV
jgi:hypothetical protein